jgi:hypothetical protein
MTIAFVNQCDDLLDICRFVDTTSMDHNLESLEKSKGRDTEEPGIMGRVVSNVMMRAVKLADTVIA